MRSELKTFSAIFFSSGLTELLSKNDFTVLS
jgi:hypothetical protein